MNTQSNIQQDADKTGMDRRQFLRTTGTFVASAVQSSFAANGLAALCLRLEKSMKAPGDDVAEAGQLVAEIRRLIAGGVQ